MKQVSPDQLDLRLNFLRPVHIEAIERMTNSMSKRGQLTPITIVEDKDRMILVDGFKRHRSAQQLKMQSLMVTSVKACSYEAKALVYLLNRGTGFTGITEALLVRDLIEIEGLTQVETATILERHKSWVSRRLAIIRALTSEIVENIQLNLLPAGVGRSLARLPRDNQADFSATIQIHGLKSSEVSKLVDLWNKAKEPAVRQCLLKSPRQALEIVNNNNDGKEKWQLLIETILAKITALNQQLRVVTISNQELSRLLQFVDLALAQLRETRECMVEGKKDESLK